MIATLVIVVPAGKISDRLPARYLIPLGYAITSCSLILFQFIPSPLKSLIPLYVIFTLLMVGSVFSMTCVETVFSRHLPKDIRGTMNGVQSFFGTISGLIFTKIGGYLYDIYGPKSPFLLIAIVNLVFASFVMLTGLTGKFKH